MFWMVHTKGLIRVPPRSGFGQCLEKNHANLETFLFDFSGDLYGAPISVALVKHLRGEETFDSVDGLIAQMNGDCAKARSVLSAL